jgi:hypothetical protein
MNASAIIADVLNDVAGEPVFLTGSLVAEDAHGKTDAHSDVDLFCPTSTTLMTVGQRLLDQGYTFAERFDRVWHRWRTYEFNKWHTNSLRLISPQGVDTNLVYKLVNGHPTTSLAQVLESFDFGLLGMGYDVVDGTYRDMRSFLFPGLDPNGPLPMMPSKRDAWRNGFISQYNGLREAGRYSKYYEYGYDMSEVKDDLVTGYRAAALYFAGHFDKEKQTLGKIYEAIADHIELDNTMDLKAAYKTLNFTDPLDEIMEKLE